MDFLSGLHGGLAAILLCGLLLIDEAGVPLPLAPNEILLIVGGLLMAGGTLVWFLFLPAAYLCMAGGMLLGYSWAHQLGPDRLRTVASRIRALRAYDRARERMLDAGPAAIGVTRCIPGIRIYATLAAGAADVPLRRFLRGALPGLAAWLLALSSIGFVVGVPAVRLFNQVEQFAVTGGVLVFLGFLCWIAARTSPSHPPDEPDFSPVDRLPQPLRVLLSAVIDVGVLVVLINGLDMLVRIFVHQHLPGVGAGLRDFLIVAGAVLFVYLLGSRLGPGETAGERVLDISYIHPQQPRSKRARPTAAQLPVTHEVAAEAEPSDIRVAP